MEISEYFVFKIYVIHNTVDNMINCEKFEDNSEQSVGMFVNENKVQYCLNIFFNYLQS